MCDDDGGDGDDDVYPSDLSHFGAAEERMDRKRAGAGEQGEFYTAAAAV